MSKKPESIDKITRARLAFSAFGSVVSIALTMFFVGLLAVLAVFSTRFIHNLSSNFELEVLFFSPTTVQDSTLYVQGTADSLAQVGRVPLMKRGVNDADVRNYELQLKSQPFVATSRFSSQAQNTAAAKEAVGNNYEEVLDNNPITASIFLTLKPEYTSQDSLKKVLAKIKENEQVQDVVYSQEIAEYIQLNLNKLQWVILGVCAMFMLISLLLIGNNIRLNIYAKRFNIKSMLLIGATRSFVRRPFVLKGFWQGMWGGFIAVILLGLVMYAGYVQFPEFIDFSNQLLVVLLLSGDFMFSILFTMLCAWICANRYIKINPDSLYL
ncbi:MAG: permease-like cell division protein FtsX [Bacteroidales bacterium]|nr:permease-like cell division protein FtsX [Bacteroidales bacterium]